MRRKTPEIDFVEEAAQARAKIEAMIGQEVSISLRYCLGAKPKLVAIDGEIALLQYPNGAWLKNVPLRDLVDDSGFWKR